MTPRKIRMTAVGLVAMPAHYDECTVTADDLASDSALCTGYAEVHALAQAAEDSLRAWRDDAATDALYGVRDQALDLVTGAWDEALDAASDNRADAVRAALERARRVTLTAGCSTEHEDAALAMLPPVAGRRAA